MDSADWDKRYADSELIWSAGPNQFVEAACAGLKPGRAVDLAAGEGRNALWLASRGWQVKAVDFSQVALDKGAEIERRRTEALGVSRAADVDPRTAVDWECGDATSWRGTGYDLAVLAYLQLPALQLAAATRNSFDALVPGGTFLLVAHDASNLTEGTGGPQDPALLPTADQVLSDLAGRDFEVIRAGVLDRMVGHPAAAEAASHQRAQRGAQTQPSTQRAAVAKDLVVQLVSR